MRPLRQDAPQVLCRHEAQGSRREIDAAPGNGKFQITGLTYVASAVYCALGVKGGKLFLDFAPHVPSSNHLVLTRRHEADASSDSKSFIERWESQYEAIRKDVIENIKRGKGRTVTQRRGAKRAASISTSTGVRLEMKGKFFLKKDYPYGAQIF